MSKITTHILDVPKGKPAEGVSVKLFSLNEKSEWKEIANGITNSDGRVTDLLPIDIIPEKGIYKIKFMTGEYFKKNNTAGFYPFVEIVFEIDSSEHYHIPLLLSPFGYTTYRGS